MGPNWRKHEANLPPLVTSRREANAQRIASCDRRAEALGLRPGTGIADARARHPELVVEPEDTHADRHLLLTLADWCDRYTPLVGLDEPDGLFLDISGCAHLFGGEEAMRTDALARLARQGFEARAGLASTPGAAWALVRYGSEAMQSRGIAQAEERQALAAMPLGALRLEAQARQGLESVGLKTVGVVADAPRAPLARRFGTALIARLDQAFGASDEAISPRFAPAPLSAERHLFDPLQEPDRIEELCGHLAVTLRPDLERQGLGVLELELALFRVDGVVSRVRIALSRPTREPAVIRRICREKLSALGNALEPGYGFDLVRLSVTASAPFETPQTSLVAESRKGDEAAIALLADRITARLGESTVRQPTLRDTHWPERAVGFVPFGRLDGTPSDNLAIPARPMRRHPVRPIYLFAPPERIEVTAAEVPEGPPRQFRWRRVTTRVVRSEGPERLAPEWWLDPQPWDPPLIDPKTEETQESDLGWTGQKAIMRDYFRIEDEDGRRYWLFRQGLYGTGPNGVPRWFLHGLFA
ncbi:DNA polymerase Y family protein [Mesorhizobium sp. RP14(2022)]|uniref:DNA polymerase Y family protein n=1 Tax=Mesorhizobium liriopis TaxID=2953882 RepID=A0ABT1C827_9HYPH|nr:DNA polymerase Y family protein [Mesorhizobium liriopis]MCO6050987.1 DNA polymerase Y family protein [Mesorhizobium liriopis]